MAFAGTPPFAATVLNALMRRRLDYKLVGVLTAPDWPAVSTDAVSPPSSSLMHCRLPSTPHRMQDLAAKPSRGRREGAASHSPVR